MDSNMYAKKIESKGVVPTGFEYMFDSSSLYLIDFLQLLDLLLKGQLVLLCHVIDASKEQNDQRRAEWMVMYMCAKKVAIKRSAVT